MFEMVPPLVLNAVVCLVIVAGVGIVRHARHPADQEQRRALQLKAKIRHFESVIREWNKRPLLPVDEKSTSRLLGQNRLVCETDLSALQRAKIHDTVSNLLQYYRQPTFEGFYALRTNVGATIISFDGLLGMQMEFFRTNRGVVFPSDKHSALKLLWYLNSTNKEIRVVPALRFVSEDGIRTFVVQTVSSNGPAHRRAGKICTLTHGIPPGGLVAEETPQTISRSGGTNVFADVFFFARSSASSNTGPFLFSYYWSPKQEEWIPHRLYCDAQTRFRSMF